MIEAFTAFPAAARALLAVQGLSQKEGQFCGGLAFRPWPISTKQAHWLRVLLARHDLPTLAQGAEHV